MEWWRLSQVTLFVWTSSLAFGSLCAEQLVYSFTNQVGAGNFSYFKLHKEGLVRLVLTSNFGDADLYVSSATLAPNYLEYELKSATCGDDSVEIPVEMARPVGIGIFGHPSYEVTDFNLLVYADDYGPKQDTTGSRSSPTSSDEQEESVLWSIFLGLLKIILDILV